jgi:hypothetical protein
MTQQLNSFKQKVMKGMLDLNMSNMTVSAQVWISSGSTLYAGSCVKLKDVAGAAIIIDKAAATDSIIGVVILNPRKASFVAGDMVEIALFGSAIYMEASGAVSRGALVEQVASGDKAAASGGSNTIIGIALDKAANGAYFRILVTGYPIPLVAAITSGTINNTAIGGSTPAAGAFTTLAASGAAAFAAAVTGKTFGCTSKSLTSATTIALDCRDGDLQTLTPAHDATINASNQIAGQKLSLILTTSGTTAYTLTFGTGFKSSGTLGTGEVSAKKFVIQFVSDGTSLVELARSAAL